MLTSAQDRIKRLEEKEGHMKKSYDDLNKRSDEDFDGCADLRDSKLATFNHFLVKWENANLNEDKEGEDITALKNGFSVTLRKYFPKEIEANRNALGL